MRPYRPKKRVSDGVQSWHRVTHTQDFGENENENHSDEQPGLLGSSSDTSVTDNSDGKTSGHTRQTDSKTSTELDEVVEKRRFLLQVVGDQHGNDQTVDTNNTRHDDGNNVCAAR